MSKTVLITGISGFIGLYCAKELLDNGYEVIGTVRNLAKKEEVINTFKKNDINIKNLSFEILELTSDNGWDKAMKCCEFVMHVASPFRIANPKNEDEMILPAVEGTRRVLEASQKAGVKRIVITSPANNNQLSPEVLVAANAVGINEIYKIGGAQAIAALTFGTESIKRVDKIVGPGNSFVTEAKKQLYGYVGIDSIAGPSQILVIADRHNNPKWVAMDLLSQAEHDEEAKAILISNSKDFINKVNKYLLKFLKSIKRTEIATKSIKNNGLAILIEEIDFAHCIANYIAPEHLEIMTKNKKSLAKKIINAGAIFMGEYTPEAFGDYIAGPSHVLPTSGNARFESGLSVLDFLKRTSYIEANKKGLKNTLHSIETLGNSEGLDAHVKSAKIRFSKD